jgi:hypothetical protein
MLRCALASGLLLCAASARAESVDELIARAASLHLAEDPQWLRLGHWSNGKSLARGNDFFVATDGATNPAAELSATLRAIYGQVPLTPDQVTRKVVPAQCRFPARASYLLMKLQFDVSKLPPIECPTLVDWYKRLNPESASLIFSSYYLNNPASAFGHTFLRIHRRDDLVSEEKRELLDIGIDYSAAADTGNPIFYAFKGLFGLFKGEFHSYPYYYKVREYNDYESRDIWEYRLNLSPQQLAMLTAHLFELGSTWFPYYYTRENCSWLILSALEAAAPGLKLLDNVKWPVIPADTVKALFDNPGLTGAVGYRASARTTFLARIKGMPLEEIRTVEKLASDANAPVSFDQAEQIRVFDAAADLIDVRFAKELVHEPDGEGGKLKQRVLERRASILVPSPELQIEPPLDKRPDVGHGSGRADVAGGASQMGGGFAELGFRLALHDLADPPNGYPELSQIQFFPTQLRWYPRSGAFSLERADFVDAISLHSVSAVDQSLSWRARLGSRRLRDAGCDCYAGGAEIGSGLTLGLFDDRLALFAMANFETGVAPALRGLHALNWLRAGAGPFGGVRLRLDDRLVLFAQAQWSYFPAAIERTSWELSAQARVLLSKSLALGLSAKMQPDANEASAQLYMYY